ncbi:MAG: transcription termination/antitermination protein NusG [Candidatus Levybacteria bacterium CG10_big_fil_rev_8_21_14_0_10_35_13]|nr:MAG: transcription termination/antitermination protein NusG [Candidatus Levybacteria bacterium CG10_big_fil_rev_8_21_14_0_10_35_13]
MNDDNKNIKIDDLKTDQDSDEKPVASTSNVADANAVETITKTQSKDETQNLSVSENLNDSVVAKEPKQTLIPDKKAKPSASDKAKWYIVHTYSGHENKVAKSLNQRVESMGFENRIFDIIVPTRDTVKVSQGKKENVKEKIFPGYVLVKMILDDESWLLVRTTQGVTAFIGTGNKPTPISDKEVEAIQKFMHAEEPLYTTSFTIGEAVKIVDGPFADFLGTVDNIDDAKGKLKVLVSIFGRETPVELDFLQVSKL